MARNYIFVPGEYYHLYARGFEKFPVYRKETDYRRFIESLYLLNDGHPINIRDVKDHLPRGLTSGEIENLIFHVEKEETIVDIGAYCLMPNHFHLLVYEKIERGISKFMQKLMTSYTMYFNKKYDRTGVIFSSSFKARHIIDDVHLKYLFAYIHLNPKKIVGAQGLKKYAYSSYLDYIEYKRPQSNILNKKAFPNYFCGSMEQEINEWLLQDAPEV